MRSKLIVILKSKLTFIILGLLIIALAYKLFPIEEVFYKIKPNNFSLQNKIKDSVVSLAATALKSKDIPISAALLYNDTVIGVGTNNCKRDTIISGHAEINAINTAIKKYGRKEFDKLDRTKLVLVSTLEPCLMCEGAILEANIKKVVFLKEKELKYWNNLYNQRLNYLWKKESLSLDELQDSLLNLHPDYNP